MFGRYVIHSVNSSWRKLNFEYFAGKMNIMHVHKLRDGLNASVKDTGDNDVNKYVKKSEVTRA